ncbi:MAG: exodeoxyribonuclease VII small subunit [Planctomycetes bacterium]|nr:exodeoxyribonuclease VII small subunit [Planctomycetota bacterium]
MARKNNPEITPPTGERFENLVASVEEALRALEGGELPLEDALKRYEEGVKALRKCYGILKQAEARVLLLTEQNGQAQTRPFDAEGETHKAPEENAGGKLF